MRDAIGRRINAFGNRIVPVPGKVNVIPKFGYLTPSRDDLAGKGGS